MERDRQTNGSGRTEKLFYDQGGVLVTLARLVVEGKTYPLESVKSAESRLEAPSRKWAWIAAGIGALVLIFGVSIRLPILMAVGVVLAGGSVFWILSVRPVHALVLKTASGETRALLSSDEPRIRRIAGAITEALAARR
ncbi:MAG: hypothetical protein FJ317_03750 [SAR202 cluster bacterium]|nr:hypothetical protein [SAR202 cluster bacterium]